MLNEQTFEKLYAMKLVGMADALKDQMGRTEMDDLAFEERFGMLVDAQALFRENKRMKRLLENAKLKVSGSMEDIDYRTSRGLDKSVMLISGRASGYGDIRMSSLSGRPGPGRPSSPVPLPIRRAGRG